MRIVTSIVLLYLITGCSGGGNSNTTNTGQNVTSSPATPPIVTTSTTEKVLPSMPLDKPENYIGGPGGKTSDDTTLETAFGPETPQSQPLNLIIIGAYHHLSKKPELSIKDWAEYIANKESKGVFKQITRGRSNLNVLHIQEWKPYTVPAHDPDKKTKDSKKCLTGPEYLNLDIDKSLSELKFNPIKDRIVVVVGCGENNTGQSPLRFDTLSSSDKAMTPYFKGQQTIKYQNVDIAPGIVVLIGTPSKDKTSIKSDNEIQTLLKLPASHPARNKSYERGFSCQKAYIPRGHKSSFAPIKIGDIHSPDGSYIPGNGYINYRRMCIGIFFHELAHSYGWRTTSGHTGGILYSNAIKTQYVDGVLKKLTGTYSALDAVGNTASTYYIPGWGAGTRFGAGFISYKTKDIKKIKSPLTPSSKRKHSVTLTSMFSPTNPGFQVLALDIPGSNEKVQLWVYYYSSLDKDGEIYEVFKTAYPKRQFLAFDLVSSTDGTIRPLMLHPLPQNTTNAWDKEIADKKKLDDLVTSATLGKGETTDIFGVHISEVQPLGDKVTFNVTYK